MIIEQIVKKYMIFFYKYRKKIILCSFLIALTIFLVSIFTLNEGGLNIIILYPLALIGFLADLYIEGGGRYIRFSFPITAMFIAIAMFILGFFVEI